MSKFPITSGPSEIDLSKKCFFFKSRDIKILLVAKNVTELFPGMFIIAGQTKIYTREKVDATVNYSTITRTGEIMYP